LYLSRIPSLFLFKHPELDITENGKLILITSKKINPKCPLCEDKKKSDVTAA